VTQDAVPIGRRERRKLEARTRLLAAARRMIAEDGAENLRIVDLTERADIGFGSFYSHFASKDEIIEVVAADAIATVARLIGSFALEFEDPAETASISYRRFLRFASDDPELAGIFVQLSQAESLFENALLPYARETLQRGIDSGRFQIGDIDLCLTSVSAAALAAIRGILAGRLSPDSAVFGAEMMLRGFGVDLEAAGEIAHRKLPEIDVTAVGQDG
jgi:AcrR family transcriptional regulator